MSEGDSINHQDAHIGWVKASTSHQGVGDGFLMARHYPALKRMAHARHAGFVMLVGAADGSTCLEWKRVDSNGQCGPNDVTKACVVG